MKDYLLALIALFAPLGYAQSTLGDRPGDNLRKAPYEISVSDGRVVDKKECLEPDQFRWDNRNYLVGRLRDFMRVAPNRRLRRFTLVPCDRLGGGELWGNAVAQAFGIADSAVAHLRLEGRAATIQLTGAKDPHELRINGFQFDLFSFNILNITTPPVVMVHLRARKMPSIADAAQAERLIEDLVGVPGIATSIYVTPDSGVAGPDYARPSLFEDSPRFTCGRGVCSELTERQALPVPPIKH